MITEKDRKKLMEIDKKILIDIIELQSILVETYHTLHMEMIIKPCHKE